jgi:hypothetical protein
VQGRASRDDPADGEALFQVDHRAQAVTKQTFFVNQQNLKFATHRLQVPPERPLYSAK